MAMREINEAAFAWQETTGLGVSGSEIVNVSAPLGQRPHMFIGVQFYATDVRTNASTGTYTVEVETMNNPGVWQPITDGTDIDATTDPDTLSVASNVARVRITFTSFTGVDETRVILTANGA